MEFMTAEFFSAVGFPAAVCVYTLFFMNRGINHLTDAVKVLSGNISRLSDKIDALQFEVKLLSHGEIEPYSIFRTREKPNEHRKDS